MNNLLGCSLISTNQRKSLNLNKTQLGFMKTHVIINNEVAGLPDIFLIYWGKGKVWEYL